MLSSIRLKRTVGLVLSIGGLLALPGVAGAVNVTSDFTLGDEGWTTQATGDLCDDPPTMPEFNAAGGVPGGYIADTDDEDVTGGEECTWTANAPASFLGDLTANYGGTVSYDLHHDGSADTGGAVSIRDSSGNTIQTPLPSTQAAPAPSSWTHYEFTITETSGDWLDQSTFEPATKERICGVLADAAAVFLLGDLAFESSGEETGIDNASLQEPATPPAADCSPADGDGDGVPDASDTCPTQSGPASNGGCPVAAQPGDDCEQAKKKLKQAKKELKKLKQKDASEEKIAKAKKKVKKAKKKKKQACATARPLSFGR